MSFKKIQEEQKFKIWRKIQSIEANNFGASGNNLTKLVLRDVSLGRDKFGHKVSWKSHHYFFLVVNSARFQPTFAFDREYLRNGSRYRQSEN